MYYNAKCLFVKRAVSMLLAGGMLCGSAGCDRSETSSGDSDSTTSKLQSTSISSNQNTITEKSSSDSSEQDVHTSDYDVKAEIMIDKHVIVLPCTVKDLNDVGISLDFSTLASFEGNDGKITNATQIYYNDNILGMVCFNGVFNDKDDFNNALVVQLLISKHEAERCSAYVSYSGLDFQSTKEKVIEKLGDGYCDFYGSPHYGTPERHIYIDIGADNKISSFELSVEDC